MPEKIFVRCVKRLGNALAAARRIKDIIKIYVYYVVCFRGVTAKFYKFRPRLFLVKHAKTPYCARPWQTALRHICAVGQTPPTSPAITPSNDRLPQPLRRQTSFRKHATPHAADSPSRQRTRARCSRRQAAQTHIDYAANAHIRAKCGTEKTDKYSARMRIHAKP